MKIKLHVVISDAESNMETTLIHTGIAYPTTTIMYEREIEIPDMPKNYRLDRITINGSAE